MNVTWQDVDWLTEKWLYNELMEMAGNLSAGEGGEIKKVGDPSILWSQIVITSLMQMMSYSPPKTYIRRYKTIKLHTKRSEAKGRGLILHPQVTGFYKRGKIMINGAG